MTTTPPPTESPNAQSTEQLERSYRALIAKAYGEHAEIVLAHCARLSWEGGHIEGLRTAAMSAGNEAQRARFIRNARKSDDAIALEQAILPELQSAISSLEGIESTHPPTALHRVRVAAGRVFVKRFPNVRADALSPILMKHVRFMGSGNSQSLILPVDEIVPEILASL